MKWASGPPETFLFAVLPSDFPTEIVTPCYTHTHPRLREKVGFIPFQKMFTTPRHWLSSLNIFKA